MPAAAAVPTRTGTSAAGNVRGRAPAIQAFMAGQLARSRQDRPNPPARDLPLASRRDARAGGGRPHGPDVRRRPCYGCGTGRRRAPDRPTPPGPGGGDQPQRPRTRPLRRCRRRRVGAHRRPPGRGRRRPRRAHERQHRRAQGSRAHPRLATGIGPGHLGGPRRRSGHRPLALLPPRLPHRRAGRRRAGHDLRHAVGGARALRRRCRGRRRPAGRHPHERRAHRPRPLRPVALPPHHASAARHHPPSCLPTATSATA